MQFSLSSTARREIRVRASNLESVLRWVCTTQRADEAKASLRASAEDQIREARILTKGRIPVFTSGADLQCADRYLDAAYVNILRLAPRDYVDSLLTNLLMEGQQHLPSDDPRLDQLKQLQSRTARDQEPPAFEERDRNVVIATLQAIQSASSHEVGRVRNLRSVIMGVAGVTMLLALGIGVFSAWSPDALPMCFAPDEERIVCPITDQPLVEGAPIAGELREAAHSFDASLVMGVGLLGAALSAAAGLRQMTASRDPYSLQVTLAIVKLPLGAVTAFLGVLLLRAEFVPGLSALDSSAQIIGWAIVLGYAQQLFTRLVDRHAVSVLQQAASAPEPVKTSSTPVVPGPAATPAVA